MDVRLLAANSDAVSHIITFTCELLQERLEKYDELMDALVFLDESFVMSNQEFQQFYTLKVTHEVLAGEMQKISDAKREIERLCR